MYTISSEQIIGSYAIRYKTLLPIINNNYTGCKSNTINIFIDIADMLRTITKQPVEGPNPYSITASIVNLCAHYRNFFKQYYKTDTRIFLITSMMDDNTINKKFIPEYTKNIFGSNLKINSIIKNSLGLLDILTPYIEDVYSCITTCEFGVYVKDIVIKDSDNNLIYPGIIISKDIYNYQMVSNDYTMMRILRPKKEGPNDTSYLVTYANAVNTYCVDRKTNCIPNIIDASLMSFIFAITRMPERNLKSVHQIPASIKAINDALLSGKVINGYTTDIEYLCDHINKSGQSLKIRDPFLIHQRFNALDLELQYIAYDSYATNRYDRIVNLYDPKAVKEISMKYFKEYPLDLNVL